jgi:hypothetical protein
MPMPDLIPGPTIIGSMPRNLMMLERKECMTLGTTEETMTSSTSSGSRPLSVRNCLSISPYSSAVWFALLVMR